jgi:hypothetical protein
MLKEIAPIRKKAPDIILVGWVVTTDYDEETGQPPSVGLSDTDPATWPEDFDGVEDLLLTALRHADGRRAVIDIRFVDEEGNP